METCVLIPKELSLQAVLPVANVMQRPNKRHHHHHAEPEITVMTNVNVPRGTLIYPFQGTVRMDKLDVFSFLDDTDVSTRTRYTIISLEITYEKYYQREYIIIVKLLYSIIYDFPERNDTEIYDYEDVQKYLKFKFTLISISLIFSNGIRGTK